MANGEISPKIYFPCTGYFIHKFNILFAHNGLTNYVGILFFFQCIKKGVHLHCDA